MDDRLARVRWEMGQTLLPEHLQAQEESLLTDTISRLRMRGLPAYGIGTLMLNEALMNEGILAVQEMALVTASGLLLDVPGNATLLPLNLNVLGSTSVSVYLHLLVDSPTEGDDRGGWKKEAEGQVPKVVNQLVLSSEQGFSGAVESMKLADFKKDPEGLWSISGDFIPPLLQLGTTPFLKSELDDLAESLELFKYNLFLEASSYLSGEGLFNVKQCLKRVLKTQRLVANLKSQIHFHPYYLYEDLLILYTDICFYRSTNPEDTSRPYDHDNLTSLVKLVRTLIDQMLMVKSRSPYLPFELHEGIYQVKLPDEIRQATDVYFLVQKEHISTDLAIDDLKIAGLTRLPFVHKMALQGLVLKKVDKPPFQHPFGAEVDFYLIREGEEWDHALGEMAAAFYSKAEFKDSAFFIYWRMG